MIGTVIEQADDRIVLSLSPADETRSHLNLGDTVEVELVQPQARARRRFAPGQLMREHAEIFDELPVDRDWIDAKPVGREIF